MCEYPVIDGIPIIVSDVRAYISQNIIPILNRDDLSATMESLIGDCCGPGSAFDALRQQLSVYCFSHYGDMDPEESTLARDKQTQADSSVSALLKKGLGLMDGRVPGPILDIGCAVGRTSFDLAEEYDDIVLGIDLNFGFVRQAAGILKNGAVNYPKRHTGIVYEPKKHPASFVNHDKVDFWVCDAANLPFADENFSLAVSLNILDCINSPYDHLSELARTLQFEGKTCLCTPYDWSVNATPIESWMGGHSQRSGNKGSSEKMVRSLLAEGTHPNAFKELSLEFEEENIPWTLRLHDRSSMQYMVHMLGLRKQALSKA